MDGQTGVVEPGDKAVTFGHVIVPPKTRRFKSYLIAIIGQLKDAEKQLKMFTQCSEPTYPPSRGRDHLPRKVNDWCNVIPLFPESCS